MKDDSGAQESCDEGINIPIELNPPPVPYGLRKIGGYSAKKLPFIPSKKISTEELIDKVCWETLTERKSSMNGVVEEQPSLMNEVVEEQSSLKKESLFYFENENNKLGERALGEQFQGAGFMQAVKKFIANPQHRAWKIGGALSIGLLICIFLRSIKQPAPINRVNNAAMQQKEMQNRMPAMTQANNVSVKPNMPEPQKVATISFNDMELGSICLGDNISKVQRTLGREKLKENRKNGYEFYSYNTMEVGIKNNKVMALVSNGKSVVTKRNIREGSTINEVLAAYGSNYLLTDFENLNLYEYNYDINNNSKAVLRFAVNKASQRVDYISLRMD